jgi:gliding motility-associated-like protein
MNTFSHRKIKNINEFGLKKVIVVFSFFLLISAKGIGQTAIASNSGPICAGADVKLFESGVGATSWLWSSNGAALFNDPTFQNPIASGAVNGEIFTVSINGNISSATTTVIVNALPIPTLTSSDADNNFCEGTSVTFTAGGGTNFDFRVGGVTVQNGSSSTYITTSLTNGQVVDVIVTNTATGCSATSPGIINTVNALPIPTLTSSDVNNIFCAGTSVTFTAGGGTNYNFRVGGVTVQDGASTNYITSSLTNGQVVDVIVTNTTTGCTATSPGITNTVNALPIPTLTSSDVNNIFCAGTSVTFTAGGGTNYNFRVGTISVQNGLSDSYTSSSLTNGQVVDVIVTNASGCTATSPGITNTVYALPAPSLTSSDADNTFCQGTSVTFTAGGGTNFDFRVGGVTVQNGSSSTYITTSLTNGQVVDVIVTNANGCTAKSTGITNTVNALPIPTLTSSDADNNFCAGTSVIFTAGGGTNFDFRVGGVTVQNGSSSTYTTTSLNNGDIVDVIVTTAGGCTATSTGITNTVNQSPTPTLTSSDADNTFCAGTSVTFTAGGGTNFNFRVGGVSVQNGTSTTYTTSSLTNGKVIDVIVSNATGCTATSAGITNTVIALPVPTLVSSDADNTFCQGTSVTFTAGGGTNYDFRIGGVTIQTGASSTYITTSLTNGQIVTVVVTNSSGCSATSGPIQNIVNPLPVFYISTPANCSPDYSTYSLGVTVVGSGTLTCPLGVVTPLGGGVWTITGIPKGNNVTLTVTDVSGCQSVLVVTAPVCNCPVIASPVSGGDKSYCVSGVIPDISATVPTGETVDWYDSPAGGTLLKNGSLSYTPIAAGTYYALARNTSSGCISSTRTSITVTMNSLPVPTLTSSDANNIFCAGTNVIFTAGGGTSFNFRVNGVSVQTGLSTTYTTSSLTTGQIVDVIVTNANGCSATSAPITNTVNPVPIPTIISSDADNIFCAGTSITFTAGGGTSYNFMIGGLSIQNGVSTTYTTNTLTNGQIVSVVVSNASGCTATSSGITNTVNPIPTATLNSSDADNIFCSGTSVTFNAGGGTSYNFRVDGVSVQNGTSAAYTTSSLTDGQIVDVIVSNTLGCTGTSGGIRNTVKLQPNANAGTGGNVCDLNFKFSAVPSTGIGTWTKTTGPGTATYSPNENTANATVAVTEFGAYTFTWTEMNGQCSSSSAITVNFYLQPVANAGTGGNNCGLGYRFNASLNAGLGTWAKVSGPGNVSYSPDANTSSAQVTVTTFGTYTFSWTVNNGTCSNTANVTVVFIQQLAADAGSGGNSCNKEFNLNAVVPSTGIGTWTKVSGPGNAVFTPDNHHPDALVTVDKFGSYSFAWTVVNSICSSSDNVIVIFHDIPFLSAGRDTAMCKGNSVQLLAVGTGTVLWVPSAFVSNPNIINPIATPDTTTTFKVNLTDQFGCKNSDSLVVVVKDRLLADAGPDQVLDYVYSTTMSANLAHSYENGVWSIISGTGTFTNSTYTNTGVQNLSIGKNTILWTVTNGICQPSYDTVLIVVKDFIIPTLITPNMDGRNDYFVLRGLTTLGKTELIIFDRRGVQVYRNNDYKNLWNGVDYNNNPLPDDTYFYVIKTANGKSISGYLVIRR